MLKRTKNPIPDFVKKALIENHLMQSFSERPAYQQNDYIGWIARAKKQDTQAKRLSQMMRELEAGGIYMNMKHPASSKNKN